MGIAKVINIGIKDFIEKILYPKELSHTEIGELGEDLACDFLRSKGYRILNRNIKIHRNEIDIVATDNKIAIFIEVKSSTSLDYNAGFKVNYEKEERIRRASEIFLQRRDVEELERRYDIVEVYLTPKGKLISIKHIENAF